MRARHTVSLLAALALAAGAFPASAYGAAPGLAARTAPVAVADAVTLAGETAKVVDVLANDTWADPAALAVAPDGQPGAPAHGTLAVSSISVGGVTRPAISYNAEKGWYGADTFAYTLTDASGLSSSASVAVTVTAVRPSLGADAASVAPGDSVRVAVLDNDTDPYAGHLHVTAVTTAAHGTATIVDSGSAISYAPALGWSGADAVTYTASADSGATATAQLTVTTLRASPGHDALLSAPASLIVLRSTRLTGAVSPYAGSLPAVAVQTLGSVGWRTTATVAPDSHGSFSVAWTARTPGVVRMRTLAIWPDGTSASSVPTRTTVVGAADPAVSGPLRRGGVLYSYRPGCPVGPASLRRLSVNYWDYAGVVRRGDVILFASAVRAVRTVFTQAFAAGFRVKKILPADAYYRRGAVSPTQSDISAMNDGDTSAFNCRSVTGSRYRISQHSYGNAIDVNTFENPYATASRIYPVAGAYRYYVMRSKHLYDIGVISPRSAMARAFAGQHWLWGARWSRHDYQHFSSNGG